MLLLVTHASPRTSGSRRAIVLRCEGSHCYGSADAKPYDCRLRIFTVSFSGSPPSAFVRDCDMVCWCQPRIVFAGIEPGRQTPEIRTSDQSKNGNVQFIRDSV